ncbi:MAG: class I SAM-dependent methyltransferase, partial [Candidatus Electrothrix sp. AUS4]|nr:class I SAM-dependent methyltransferase [Candidatus Electrothrix sp. AUS4]
MEKIDDFWTTELNSYLAVKDESRKKTLYPKILEIIQKLKPGNILDFGCGDGELLSCIKSKCKAKISAYDRSNLAIKAIKSRFGATEVKIYEAQNDILSATYDVIICSLVLMTIDCEEELEEVLNIIYNAKARNGHVIFAITHPCFRQYQYSTFVTQQQPN